MASHLHLKRPPLRVTLRPTSGQLERKPIHCEESARKPLQCRDKRMQPPLSLRESNQSVAPLEQVCITCSDAVAPLRCDPLAFFHVNINMLYITEELKVNYYSMHIIYYSWVYTASLDSLFPLKELGFI